MKLFNFHSSSTSFRTRIALNLKGIEVEQVPVHLRWKNGDQDADEYKARNPQANVPILVLDDGHELVQSMAIIEYLDETHPEPALLPADPIDRARVRALALWIACEIQPLNNLRTQRKLVELYAADRPSLSRWQLLWVEVGFDALEKMLATDPRTGNFCHGNAPTIADLFLVPQVYNSQRPVVGADLGKWPIIKRIYDRCLAVPAFDRALPTKQPGFESPDGH